MLQSLSSLPVLYIKSHRALPVAEWPNVKTVAERCGNYRLLHRSNVRNLKTIEGSRLCAHRQQVKWLQNVFSSSDFPKSLHSTQTKSCIKHKEFLAIAMAMQTLQCIVKSAWTTSVCRQKPTFFLEALDTFGNCQRPVFSLGVSQHMHKITNQWKFWLNYWSCKH